MAISAPEPDPRPTYRGWAVGTREPVTVWLIRHGATALTARKCFSGSGGTDPALDAVGRAEIGRLGAWFADQARVPDLVLTSPLRRARESAELLAAQWGREPEVEPGFREMDFGAWEGLTIDQAMATDPEGVAAWMGNPEAAAGGAESVAATQERALQALEARLADATPGQVLAVVTHVTPIKTLMAHLVGGPLGLVYRTELSSGSLTEIGCFAEDGRWAGSLRRFNHTA
ncbi:MAG: histidine phosphatase family protein [Nocardioides sp.]